MQIERIKTIAALVTMAASLAYWYFSVHEALPASDGRTDEALGQVLAEHAAKLLSSGGRLTLITRDTGTLENRAVRFQLKGFHQALRKSELSVAATNAIALDPLRLVRVPPAAFVDIFRKQSENDVIVSLLGPPVLTTEQRARLGEKRPRIVALCSGAMPQQVNLRELFDGNLLHVAVVSRVRPSPAPLRSDNPRDWFDCFYQVVAATNLSELPLWTNNAAGAQATR